MANIIRGLEGRAFAPTKRAATRMTVEQFAKDLPEREPHDALVSLIQHVAGGDEQALTRLYDLTVTRVYSLARAITANSEDAEDVSCETFVQVWNEAARFDPARGSALGWLMTICRSRALDARRRRLVRMRADQAETPQGELDAPPEELLALLEEESAVRAALAQLTPLRRQLVALAFFRGMTHSEIATAVKLPLGTVKSHLRRALGTLREHLEEEQ
jgi:RNA polymerase sigma-70 factor (ECF subfamily)